jgi:hypothetical protein
MHDPFRGIQRVGLARVAEILRVKLRGDGERVHAKPPPDGERPLVCRRTCVVPRWRG